MAPGFLEHRSEDGVEVAGGLAGRGRGNGGVQGAAEHQPGLVHGAHLGVGLVFDAGLAEGHLDVLQWAALPGRRAAKWLGPSRWSGRGLDDQAWLRPTGPL